MERVDGAWHIVLRDIMVILAAASVVVFMLVAVLVLWQLYRLAVELRRDAQPVLGAVRDTVETVRGTAHFVSRSAVPPAVTGVGLGLGALRVIQQLGGFYRGLRAAGLDGRPAVDAGEGGDGAPRDGGAG